MPRVNLSAHVTMENVDQAIALVAAFGLNVDYVKDGLEYNAYEGDELYLIISVNPETNSTTCTEMSPDDFHNTWVTKEPDRPRDPWLQIIDRKS